MPSYVLSLQHRLTIWHFPLPHLNVCAIVRCENSAGFPTFAHYLLICWAKGLSTWISMKFTAYLLKIKSINHCSLFPVSYLWKTFFFFFASCNVFTFPVTFDAQCCLKLSKVRTGFISAAPSPKACVFLGMYVWPERVCTLAIYMWPDMIFIWGNGFDFITACTADLPNLVLKFSLIWLPSWIQNKCTFSSPILDFFPEIFVSFIVKTDISCFCFPMLFSDI